MIPLCCKSSRAFMWSLRICIVAQPVLRRFEFSVVACCHYNFAQNVISSSVGGSHYLPQISSKSVQYSCEAKEMPKLRGTSEQLVGQRDRRSDALCIACSWSHGGARSPWPRKMIDSGFARRRIVSDAWLAARRGATNMRGHVGCGVVGEWEKRGDVCERVLGKLMYSCKLMYRKIYTVLMEANCLLRNEIWFLWTHYTIHVIPLGDAQPIWTLVWLVRDMQRH